MSESCLTPHSETVPPQRLAKMLGVNLRDIIGWIDKGLPLAGCNKCTRLNPEVAIPWLKERSLISND